MKVLGYSGKLYWVDVNGKIRPIYVIGQGADEVIRVALLISKINDINKIIHYRFNTSKFKLKIESIILLEQYFSIKISELKDKIGEVNCKDRFEIKRICIINDLSPTSKEALHREKIFNGQGSKNEVEEFAQDLVEQLYAFSESRIMSGLAASYLEHICEIYNININEYVSELTIERILMQIKLYKLVGIGNCIPAALTMPL